MHPYQPRPISVRGPVQHGDWTLKAYSISYASAAFDPVRFTEGRRLALESLPTPAITAERPGVGFLIEHQGRNVDYLVLGWWDRENELPLRVFIRDAGDDDRWRPARGSESVCVWDLQVIWAEREAYVATVLGGDPTRGREEYLRAVTTTH
jgi:hypothetical protein